MASEPRFFPDFNRILFGRPPLSEQVKIQRARRLVSEAAFDQVSGLFGSFIPNHLRDYKPAGTRVRIFSATVTFWAFLSQVIDPGASCRKALARVHKLFGEQGLRLPSEDTSAYCSARKRLRVRWLWRIQRYISQRLVPAGPRLLLIDGTTTILPDTPANQRKYPQPRTQKPGCGFPIMKLVGLFDLKSGAWLAVAKGNKHDSEQRLVRRLYKYLRPGDTVIADRGFSSYAIISQLQALGVDVIMRRHSGRRSDFRTGVRLGRNDHVILLKRPRGRTGWNLPGELVLREVKVRREQSGYRTRELILVTTKLGKEEISTEEMAELYEKRWRIEMRFDDIKTTMNMEMLRTKDPAMVCRELLMHMIGYNLIRATMLESCQGEYEHIERLSYKGTVDRINVFLSGEMLGKSMRADRVRKAILHETIARDTVPQRPGRREPRAVKRRKKPYDLLTKPRKEMKEVPHRNNYRNPA